MPSKIVTQLPLPKPEEGEGKEEFLNRCVYDATMMDEHFDMDARRTACGRLYAGGDGSASGEASVDVNAKLLAAIRLRAVKQSDFNYGILTADRYVKNIADCIGVEACYKYAATKAASFDDILRKAAQTLTYANQDMVAHEVDYYKQAGSILKKYEGIELPKNTLMVFKHVLTTPRKDRDGDILRTQGAKPDLKMLLLWQHIHTLPIGKLLVIDEHTNKRLAIVSAIVDMNPLCHDAAVMVDSKMGRFSHGFRALQYEQLKEQEGQTTGTGGFDVKAFEIMEESLVSVPSNVDAETEEVILSLVEGGKLTSPLMKQYGKSIRGGRDVRVPVTVDLNLLINGKAVGNDAAKTNNDDNTPAERCGCNAAGQGTPKQTEGDPPTGGKTSGAGLPQIEIKGYGLEDSWEEISYCLRDAAKAYLMLKGMPVFERHYVWIMATYDTYAIVSVEGGDQTRHYRIEWAMSKGSPAFKGEPVEVEIVTTTEVINSRAAKLGQKAGRVLSRANESKIRNAKECVDEASKMDVGKPCKSLLKEATADLDGVLGDLGDHPEELETSHTGGHKTVSDAIATVLAKAGPDERACLRGAMDAIDAVAKADKQQADFRALMGAGR